MASDTRLAGGLQRLTFEGLREAVGGGANYVRVRTVLQPADGPGGKVFPPTYAGPEGSARSDEARYHIEERRRGGETVVAAVLDSVASQANRAEVALLDAYAEGRVRVPLVVADFSADGGDGDYDGVLGGWLTSLEASHRVADAVFRECRLDGVAFRKSVVGRRIFASSERDASAMYRYCPTVLVFGEWDSMGGDASRGHKFERRVVSEIVAVGVVVGRASSGKLDPLRIESAVVYENKDHTDNSEEPAWTTDEGKAVRDSKGMPLEYGTGKGRGKVSGLGLGNVTPSVAAEPRGVFTGGGGVTFEQAEQSTVIALNSVRKLRFPRHRDATVDARTAVAALALASTVLRDAQGYALRSRCLLVPDGPPTVELVDAYGGVCGFAPVTADAAIRMLDQAVGAAAEAGLGWETEPVVLTPPESLRGVVRARKDRSVDGDVGG